MSNRDGNSLFGDSAPGVVKLAVYSTIAISLMVADHHGRYVPKVREQLGQITDPVLNLVNLPSALWTAATETLRSRDQLQQRNDELESQQLLTQTRLNKMLALEAENERLRQLLHSAPKLGEKVLVAELLRVSLDPYHHRVALNKGASDGVYAGQPIADAAGLIGQVESVSATNAFAMLLSDPAHAIPVVVNRTGLRSVAYGVGQSDQLQLRDITSSADIVVGDLLVSSGLGGRFPAGFPVGTVEAINEAPGSSFRQALVRPSAALDRSREVLLVWPDQQGADPTVLVGLERREQRP